MHLTTALSRLRQVLSRMALYSLAVRGESLLASSSRTPACVVWSIPRDGRQWRTELHHSIMSIIIRGLGRILLSASSRLLSRLQSRRRLFWEVIMLLGFDLSSGDHEVRLRSSLVQCILRRWCCGYIMLIGYTRVVSELLSQLQSNLLAMYL